MNYKNKKNVQIENKGINPPKILIKILYINMKEKSIFCKF